jgi:hypothetical protein
MAEQNLFCDPIEFLSGLKTFGLGLIPLVSSIDVDNSFTDFGTTPRALIKNDSALITHPLFKFATRIPRKYVKPEAGREVLYRDI